MHVVPVSGELRNVGNLNPVATGYPLQFAET